MIVALFLNRQIPSSGEVASEICRFLSSRGVEVVSDDLDASQIGSKPISSIDPKLISIIISLGGDGTILRLVHQYGHLNAAILGVNLGHLGFMADVQLDDLHVSLQHLIEGSYHIEDRLMLDGITPSGSRCLVVNDIVIHRGGNPALIEMDFFVNEKYLNTFEADGVVISTPNGSTAYSLAAGGPILSPSLEAIVITPICPHTISNRPIVLTSEERIQVECLNGEGVPIYADGRNVHELKKGGRFFIQKSDKKFKSVNLLGRDYFATLRSKLGWAGKLR